ncbi:MAG: hypothetical protein Q8P44_01450, partial [Dehalococcoidia bacterium]|nr:hypothetical protein [Dehalococcoidia bacterium]
TLRLCFPRRSPDVSGQGDRTGVSRHGMPCPYDALYQRKEGMEPEMRRFCGIPVILSRCIGTE